MRLLGRRKHQRDRRKKVETLMLRISKLTMLVDIFLQSICSRCQDLDRFNAFRTVSILSASITNSQ